MAPTHRVGKYILKKKIGEGAFAEVRLAVHEETGEEYAVKVFDRTSFPPDRFERDVRREIRIMQCLNHPNIVAVYAVLVTDRNLYLVMELVRGGELYDHIVTQHRIDENTSRRYFQQIVDALVYCHKQGVYHRDLKPENLLVDEHGRIKITDFGMSFMKENGDGPQQLLRTQCGTAKYMPPEIIVRSKKGYDGAKLDAWECGMVLFALLAGHLPFNGEDDKAVFRSILHTELSMPAHISSHAQDILWQLLEKDPNKRASLVEIRSHPWLRIGYNADTYEQMMTSPSTLELSYLESNSPETPVTSSVDQDARRSSLPWDEDEKENDPACRPARAPRSDFTSEESPMRRGRDAEEQVQGLKEVEDIHEDGEPRDNVPPLDICASGDVEEDSNMAESTFRHKLSTVPAMILKSLKTPRKNKASSEFWGEDDTPGWFAGSPASIMDADALKKKAVLKVKKRNVQNESEPRKERPGESKSPYRALARLVSSRRNF